ncbi:MAG: adenosylcobinamide-GDP ribazoletransferase [Methylotenera sp.]
MLNRLSQEARLFLLAVSFFTRIPVPSFADFKENDLNHAAKYFPLIGLIVGAIAALVFYVASKVFTQDIAVILSIVASIYVTGAFHEDGLSDAVDGLGGGRDKQQVLTIMQDSRVGSYGVIAIVLVLLLKFTTLNHLPIWLVPSVLIAGHSASRLCAVLVMATQAYAKASGKSKPLATKLPHMSLLVAVLFGLLPMGLLPPYFLWALLPVAFIWVWFSLKLNERISGYTGDCLGAMQQLTEIAFYLGVLACISI